MHTTFPSVPTQTVQRVGGRAGIRAPSTGVLSAGPQGATRRTSNTLAQAAISARHDGDGSMFRRLFKAAANAATSVTTVVTTTTNTTMAAPESTTKQQESVNSLVNHFEGIAAAANTSNKWSDDEGGKSESVQGGKEGAAPPPVMPSTSSTSSSASPNQGFASLNLAMAATNAAVSQSSAPAAADASSGKSDKYFPHGGLSLPVWAIRAPTPVAPPSAGPAVIEKANKDKSDMDKKYADIVRPKNQQHCPLPPPKEPKGDDKEERKRKKEPKMPASRQTGGGPGAVSQLAAPGMSVLAKTPAPRRPPTPPSSGPAVFKKTMTDKEEMDAKFAKLALPASERARTPPPNPKCMLNEKPPYKSEIKGPFSVLPAPAFPPSAGPSVITNAMLLKQTMDAEFARLAMPTPRPGRSPSPPPMEAASAVAPATIAAPVEAPKPTARRTAAPVPVRAPSPIPAGAKVSGPTVPITPPASERSPSPAAVRSPSPRAVRSPSPRAASPADVAAAAANGGKRYTLRATPRPMKPGVPAKAGSPATAPSPRPAARIYNADLKPTPWPVAREEDPRKSVANPALHEPLTVLASPAKMEAGVESFRVLTANTALVKAHKPIFDMLLSAVNLAYNAGVPAWRVMFLPRLDKERLAAKADVVALVSDLEGDERLHPLGDLLNGCTRDEVLMCLCALTEHMCTPEGSLPEFVNTVNGSAVPAARGDVKVFLANKKVVRQAEAVQQQQQEEEEEEQGYAGNGNGVTDSASESDQSDLEEVQEERVVEHVMSSYNKPF
uniref:Uncharacterized protein n=1 Tax=Chlamydomonas leiostraca TaxID=1034604 RepID=A0A7S0RNQ6_9CHLO|mmetsp:Transcript_271/g.656  ORF Transcript_271/g.656 Transcript_271/m.656 type:complete len:780 (+) Transcript_271:123-2462(+)